MKKLKKQLKNTKKNIAKFAAANRNKEGIKPSELTLLLDPSWVKNTLQGCADKIIGTDEFVLEAKVEPIKIYQDLRSFSFVAIYNLKIGSQDVDLREKDKKVFAVSHSDIDTEIDYNVFQNLFFHMAENPPAVLRIARPYCFIKPYNLSLREYVDGQTLKKLIYEQKKLSSEFCELLASAIVEFQKLKTAPNLFRESETISNFRDVKKNIQVLKDRNNPEWSVLSDKLSKIENNLNGIREFEKNTVLSHGDLNPSNILLTSDNRISIFDFGETGQRHYLWDIAGLYSHLGVVTRAVNEESDAKKQQELFLDSYLKISGRVLSEEEQKLFSLFRDYFELLILTHLLVWG